jgi:hypothetical protein
METFTLSRKELHRPGLLKAACAGRITNRQVTEALQISIRHVRRLRRRFEAAKRARRKSDSCGPLFELPVIANLRNNKPPP